MWRRSCSSPRCHKASASRLRPRVYRTLVISPFVYRGGLDALGIKAPRTPVDLVTIALTANTLGELSGMTMRVAGTPQRDTPTSVRERDETSAAEAPDPVAPSGLHAKLILQHNDVTRRLWISSANANGCGLAKGNAETVAELDVGVPIVALEAFAEAQALAVPKRSACGKSGRSPPRRRTPAPA